MTPNKRRKANACLSRRRIIAKAIKRGDVIRPEACEICGETSENNLQSHHWSYAKAQRLRVSFVCQECATALHTALYQGAALYPHPAMLEAGSRPLWPMPAPHMVPHRLNARRARGRARMRWNKLMLVSTG